MTAEIVVMNRYGVSMAADSAITLGPRLEYYNNHNKLFALSKVAPVGVMFYEVADLCGVPWEVLFKEYKTKLGAKTFPNLKDYLDDLISFITNISKDFPEEVKNQYVLRDTCMFFELNIDLEGKQDEEKFDQKILKISEHLSKCSDSNVLTQNVDRQLEISKNDLVDFFVNAFPNLFPNNGRLESVLNVVKLFWMKSQYQGFTGVAVAGYGENDLFPSCLSCHIGQSIGGQLKLNQIAPISIDATKVGAGIIPFGQGDIARAYLRGVHESIEAFSGVHIEIMIHHLVVTAAHLLGGPTDQEKEKALNTLSPVATSLYNEYHTKIKEFIGNDYITPILQSIQNLSKDELAVVAESLVKITSLKKKISIGDKTVGGAIDVAVISKGDGLVWIDRKHYFDGNKNPHFLAKYYQMGGHNE